MKSKQEFLHDVFLPLTHQSTKNGCFIIFMYFEWNGSRQNTEPGHLDSGVQEFRTHSGKVSVCFGFLQQQLSIGHHKTGRLAPQHMRSVGGLLENKFFFSQTETQRLSQPTSVKSLRIYRLGWRTSYRAWHPAPGGGGLKHLLL